MLQWKIKGTIIITRNLDEFEKNPNSAFSKFSEYMILKTESLVKNQLSF